MTEATPRSRMSPARRQHIFSENCTGHHIAPCCLCGEPIHRHDDAWIVEHKRALGLLGPDTNSNCGPAHVGCATEKTHREDLPRIRKAKRQQAALLTFQEGGMPKIRQASKKPARAFQVPSGVKYDWRQRRYVKLPTDGL